MSILVVTTCMPFCGIISLFIKYFIFVIKNMSSKNAFKSIRKSSVRGTQNGYPRFCEKGKQLMRFELSFNWFSGQFQVPGSPVLISGLSGNGKL